jgi:hypothetical protein
MVASQTIVLNDGTKIPMSRRLGELFEQAFMRLK